MEAFLERHPEFVILLSKDENDWIRKFSTNKHLDSRADNCIFKFQNKILRIGFRNPIIIEYFEHTPGKKLTDSMSFGFLSSLSALDPMNPEKTFLESMLVSFSSGTPLSTLGNVDNPTNLWVYAEDGNRIDSKERYMTAIEGERRLKEQVTQPVTCFDGTVVKKKISQGDRKKAAKAAAYAGEV